MQAHTVWPGAPVAETDRRLPGYSVPVKVSERSALAVERRSLGRGPVDLVLVHGFTQDHTSFEPLLGALVQRVPDLLGNVTLVDAPGHGGSARVETTWQDVAALLAEVGGYGVYLGYSMGGRLCLRLALGQPETVRALVVMGANPGIRDPAERERRRQSDRALADWLDGERVSSLQGSTVSGLLEALGEPPRDEHERLRSFLEAWTIQPLFAGLTAEQRATSRRLAANTCAGLASSLRTLGSGTQEPLWDRLAEIRMPALLMAGENDSTYREVCRESARAMGGTSDFLVIEGAGHALHLEQPALAAREVARFLSSLSE